MTLVCLYTQEMLTYSAVAQADLLLRLATAFKVLLETCQPRLHKCNTIAKQVQQP